MLAKVSRDEIMCRFEIDFPAYRFAEHKGYGTARHLAAIEDHGPCAIHRMTFAPLRQDEETQPPLF